MGFEVEDEGGRNGDDAPAGVGLWRTEHEGSVAELLVLLDDGGRAVEQIEVALAQRSELADV